MLLLKIFVFKFLPIDALTTSAVACREISTLAHEVFNNSVEGRTFVAQCLSGLALALLSSAERAEILSSFGND
jgi:hypothetical protein